MRRTNRPRWLGRMCSGQASVQRLHMTHSSKTWLDAASSPSTARFTPRWTSSPFGQALSQPPQWRQWGASGNTSPILRRACQLSPMSSMRYTWRTDVGEVIEERDLHAFLDHGLAGELGLHLRLRRRAAPSRGRSRTRPAPCSRRPRPASRPACTKACRIELVAGAAIARPSMMRRTILSVTRVAPVRWRGAPSNGEYRKQ